MTLTKSGGSDFAIPDIPRDLDEQERLAAISVVRQKARDEDEAWTFLDMLGLIDEAA